MEIMNAFVTPVILPPIMFLNAVCAIILVKLAMVQLMKIVSLVRMRPQIADLIFHPAKSVNVLMDTSMTVLI